MQQKYSRTILLAGLFLALTACGSSRSDDDPQLPAPATFGEDADGIAYIGADRCIGCHASPIFDSQQVADYLDSRHVIHSSAVNAGLPAGCLSCHDPIGDGGTLERFLDPAAVPAAGLAAVSCEACHGAGGEHFGAGPLPHPAPDFNQCGRCHTVLPAGPAGHADPSANGIVEDYAAGSHAASQQGTAIAVCSRCHSDEGYRRFIGETNGLDEGQLTTALAGATPPANQNTVQCRTCHDSHSGGLRASTISDPENGTVFSQQFNLCTSCHQVFLLATFDAVAQAFTYELDRARRPFHGTAGNPLADGNNLLIWDTHFPSAADGIVGYNIDAADAQACTTCHDPHRANKFGNVSVVPF